MINHWTLRQLRLFEAVARHRSFTRAAGEMHLTQPAVSIQIKRLEESIGLPLIEQVGKKLFLTRAGEEVHVAVTEVLDRLTGLAGALHDMKGSIAGPLSVGTVTSAKYFMPHFLGGFLARYPEVQPQLQVTNRRRIIERLSENADDFVIMGQVPADLSVSAHPFMENLLVAIAHPEHALAGQAGVPLARLAEERFLMREAGSGTRDATERLFAEQDLSIRAYMELGSSEAIKQGVRAGLGVSILSRSSLLLKLEAGRLVELDVEGLPIRRLWHAAHLHGHRLSLTARAFLAYLMQEGGMAGAEAGA